jgi:hypothetical protein
VADKAASTVVVTEKTANTTITIEKKEKPQAIVVAQPEKKISLKLIHGREHQLSHLLT